MWHSAARHAMRAVLCFPCLHLRLLRRTRAGSPPPPRHLTRRVLLAASGRPLTLRPHRLLQGVTTEKLLPLNDTVDYLPLNVTFAPTSVARWQLSVLLEQTFRTMKQSMGA